LGLSVGVEIDDRYYANYDPSTEWEGMIYVLMDFNSLPEIPADKIIIRKPSRTDIEKIKAIIPDDLYIEISENVVGMIMSRRATKYNAIQFLSEKYEIPLSYIAAFGDDYNDIEMLRECGVGVAVANALDEVKAAADYICGDCDNDGVARWIEGNVL
jgi:5-amino-6-(5-phospho-D-ribitylamino)uracil phosphatase